MSRRRKDIPRRPLTPAIEKAYRRTTPDGSTERRALRALEMTPGNARDLAWTVQADACAHARVRAYVDGWMRGVPWATDARVIEECEKYLVGLRGEVQRLTQGKVLQVDFGNRARSETA